MRIRDVTQNWIGPGKMLSQPYLQCSMNFSAFDVIIRNVYDLNSVLKKTSKKILRLI